MNSYHRIQVLHPQFLSSIAALSPQYYSRVAALLCVQAVDATTLKAESEYAESAAAQLFARFHTEFAGEIIEAIGLSRPVQESLIVALGVLRKNCELQVFAHSASSQLSHRYFRKARALAAMEIGARYSAALSAAFLAELVCEVCGAIGDSAGVITLLTDFSKG